MTDSTAPLVSFLVTCYNYGSYIRECIESILNQNMLQDFEIVAVNDSSTDETQAVLTSIHDPRLHVFEHERNQGQVAASNTATAAARGKYIARQDADNRYRPDFLRATLEVLDSQPQVDLVYGDVAAIDFEGKIIAEPWDGVGARRRHRGRAFSGNEFIPILIETHLPVVAMLARREAWMQAFPLPSWLPRLFTADDWYILTRILPNHDSYYLPHVVTDYRLHATNMHYSFEDGPQQEMAQLRALDEIFANPERRIEKERVRRASYAVVYGSLAPRYLRAGKLEDARRCYLQAFRYEPRRMFDGYTVRGFLHTLVGTSRYQGIKGRWLGRKQAN